MHINQQPHLRAALILLLAIILPSFCQASERSARVKRVEKAATVEEYPDLPWEQAYVYKNKRYVVRTNTSPKVASYIGQLLNFEQERFRGMFNFDEEVPRLQVYAYRTREEFERVALPYGFAQSDGFFMQQGADKTIYLPYVAAYNDPTYPTEILLHEGTHQFVSMALDFKIPGPYRKYFEDDVTTLKSVPLWLNEGLATYMEVARFD
ncbi:MAG: hypothetical protein JXA52_00770, partial [Planctomycetes bacterium]|nr:hypothetical protein [Planctomycetota bacterium]